MIRGGEIARVCAAALIAVILVMVCLAPNPARAAGAFLDFSSDHIFERPEVLQQYKTWLAEGIAAEQFIKASGGSKESVNAPAVTTSAKEATGGNTKVSLQKTPEVKLGDLTLGALVYFDAKHWSFWLNDKLFDQDQIPSEFKVAKISATSVTLIWKPLGALEAYQFTLAPRQTFVTLERRVIDGLPFETRGGAAVAGSTK